MAIHNYSHKFIKKLCKLICTYSYDLLTVGLISPKRVSFCTNAYKIMSYSIKQTNCIS